MTNMDARTALTQVPTGMAAKLLGIDPRTLYVWRDRGKIEAERTRTGRMLWNVAQFMERESERA
jgi:predicted site-specific integrase-resolvase